MAEPGGDNQRTGGSSPSTGDQQRRKDNRCLYIRVLLYFSLGAALLLTNPYGLSDRVDAVTQQTFYRLAAPFYQSSAREDIVVVLLTNSGIRNLQERGLFRANIWPITYRDHAYILDRIMDQGPRSLLIDIYFDRQRSTDNTLPMLRARLDNGIKEHQVDVFHASGFAGSRPTPIQKTLAEAGSSPVITGWEALGEGYPLKSVSGRVAAYALYESYCLDAAPTASCREPTLLPDDAPVFDSRETRGEGLSVYWGSNPPTSKFVGDTTGACEQEATSGWAALGQLAVNLATGLIGRDAAEPQVPCPFHRFIPADYLATVLRAGTETERDQLYNLLHDKIVLYGAALEGAVDTIDSPVHGKIPAVFLHAMALDNLMNFGTRYIRAGVAGAGYVSILAWLILVTIYAWGVRWAERRSGTHECAPLSPMEMEIEIPPDEGGGSRIRRICRYPLERARRYPKWAMSVAVALGVILFAILMFVVGRLEPVNSIAFLGLLAMLGILRGSKIEASLLGLFGFTNDNRVYEYTAKKECDHESPDTR